MNRNEIIASAMEQLGRDTQMLDAYAGKFTTYANDAILDLAEKYKPVRTDTVAVVDGAIDTATLPRQCLKILKITQNGTELAFTAGSTSEKISLGASGNVEVTYRYAPKLLTSKTDVPELPLYMHNLIVTYVVGRERASTDASNQRGANIFFEIYEAAKRNIHPHKGSDAYSIINRWD